MPIHMHYVQTPPLGSRSLTDDRMSMLLPSVPYCKASGLAYLSNTSLRGLRSPLPM